MKKHRVLIVCLVLMLVFPALVGACAEPAPAPAPSPAPTPAPAPAPAPEEPIVMRCASEQGPPEVISVVLKEMETIVPEETGGRVKFEYYPAAQLYNFTDGAAALQAGDLEMTFNGLPISFLVPEWDIMSGLLFLVEDEAHLRRIEKTDAYADFCTRMEAMGIKPLTPVYPMDDQPLFNSRHPVEKLEDLQGLKLSVGGAPSFLEATGLLSGSKPINVPVPEVPSALETGMMDGSPFPWPVMTFMDLPRLLPYVTLDPYGLAYPIGLVVSTKWWGTLPTDLQETLQSAFEAAMVRYGEQIVAVGDEQQKIYTESEGTTVTQLTDAERARWLETLKPLYDEKRQDPNLLALIEAAEATRQ